MKGGVGGAGRKRDTEGKREREKDKVLQTLCSQGAKPRSGKLSRVMGIFVEGDPEKKKKRKERKTELRRQEA